MRRGLVEEFSKPYTRYDLNLYVFKRLREWIECRQKIASCMQIPDEVFLLQSWVTGEMSEARGKITTITIQTPHVLFTVLYILTLQCLTEA